MEQQAEAKVFFVEPSPPAEQGVREQIESNAQAMAAVHDGPVREAIESVDWERRGLLRRLSGRPATR
ncbi:MAG TPA: hypothetical protein VGJ27_10960 [Gaiellaceae bacterium]|jgi:hypothetical protein